MATKLQRQGAYLRKLRADVGRTQAEFWTPLGVLQSAGSRYESGQVVMPLPVAKLVKIRYENEQVRAVCA